MFTWLIDNFVLLKDEKFRPVWLLWAGSSIVFMWIFFWWAIGLWPTDAMGAGFAKSVDLAELAQTVETRLNSVESRAVAGELLESRTAQCSSDSQQVRQFHAERIQRLMREYRELTDGPYRLPDCSELVAPSDD